MRKLALLCFLSLLFGTPAAYATIFGQIHGVAHDPQHRPIAGARVEVRAAHSDFVKTAITGPDGSFAFSFIPLGDYTVTVHGRAAHAGLDFANGASAIVEMSRQLQKIAGFTRLDRGITVSPGVIHGGTRSNVIAAECQVEIDVRIPKASDARYLERQFASLNPVDKHCSLSVTGGLNRPPLERTAGVRSLFRKAQKLAAELGVDLEESSAGGGSDGNFTAALGIPTLDGLGAVGEGAHAVNESILIARMADRIALLSKLTAAL